MAPSRPPLPAPRAEPATTRTRARVRGLWDARPPWARDRTTLALAASLLVLLALFFSSLAYVSPERPGADFTLDQVQRSLAAHQVSALELRDQDAIAVGTLRTGERFSVAYPASDAVT